MEKRTLSLRRETIRNLKEDHAFVPISPGMKNIQGGSTPSIAASVISTAVLTHIVTEEICVPVHNSLKDLASWITGSFGITQNPCWGELPLSWTNNYQICHGSRVQGSAL